MNDLPLNCHEIEIFIRLGVVLGSRVQCILSYDGLRQRCSITFSKGSVWMLEKDSHIQL